MDSNSDKDIEVTEYYQQKGRIYRPGKVYPNVRTYLKPITCLEAIEKIIETNKSKLLTETDRTVLEKIFDKKEVDFFYKRILKHSKLIGD